MSRLGFWSAVAYSAVGLIYAAVVAVGMTESGLSEPIVDPILAIMEVLTLIGAPLIVLLMAGIHRYAAPDMRIWSLIGLVFASLMVGLTMTVHFVALTAGRQLGLPGLRWPSVWYAMELLAWDVLLGLALLFVAPVFQGRRLAIAVRRLLQLTGALCILGTLGPAVGEMRWQLIGVFGYGLALPFTCLLLALLLRPRSSGAPASSGHDHLEPTAGSGITGTVSEVESLRSALRS